MTSSTVCGGFGRHEAEHVLQDRVHDGVQPVLGEGLVFVLGPPDVDVVQPGLGAPGQVRDQAGRAFGAQPVPDAGVDLGVDSPLPGDLRSGGPGEFIPGLPQIPA